MIQTTLFDSPVGQLLLRAEGDALIGLYFAGQAHVSLPDAADSAESGVLSQAARELTEWFDGRRLTFDVPICADGTPFQRRVWAALATIPYGETRSYGEIARQLGLASGASRAVGTANGRNPLSIITPCHRVIGANGRLTGYAGGLERKKALLALEQHHAGFTLTD